jgi:glycosyltransferase involved in cell wall biosynthesis
VRHLSAIVPNVPGFAPGQRLRIEQWAPYLEATGWTVEFHPFETPELHDVLYQPGRTPAKVARLVEAYARQLRQLADKADGDVVLVHKEAALVGPSLPERLVRRRARRLVYDLDDPWFVRYRSPTNGWLTLLRFPGKTRSIMRMADEVTAINGLIGEYASRFNRRVTVIPCLVDAESHRPPAARPSDTGEPVRLAWIGSRTAAPNLLSIAQPLRAVQDRSGAVLTVIGDVAAVDDVSMAGPLVESVAWSEETEVAALARCDIGLVPVAESPWSRWKYFFKTVQYMAMGMPVVAQATGSNPEVVDDGVDGFLVRTPSEWQERLTLLIENAELRATMGAAARKKALAGYSIEARMPDVIALFDRLARPQPPTSGR